LEREGYISSEVIVGDPLPLGLKEFVLGRPPAEARRGRRGLKAGYDG
jgi:hypothetical protein